MASLHVNVLCCYERITSGASHLWISERLMYEGLFETTASCNLCPSSESLLYPRYHQPVDEHLMNLPTSVSTIYIRPKNIKHCGSFSAVKFGFFACVICWHVFCIKTESYKRPKKMGQSPKKWARVFYKKHRLWVYVTVALTHCEGLFGVIYINCTEWTAVWIHMKQLWWLQFLVWL